MKDQKRYERNQDDNENKQDYRDCPKMCAADGQKCNGLCRKKDSKEGVCQCPFQFNEGE